MRMVVKNIFPFYNVFFHIKKSPYPIRFSTIDGNCRHLRYINFLHWHVQRQRAGMDGEWVFTLPIFKNKAKKKKKLVKDMILT